MGVRGVHFALDDAALKALLVERGGDARLDHVTNVIEANWDAVDHAETDSSWAYIHSGLTGTDPDGDAGGEDPHGAPPFRSFGQRR